MNLNQPLADFLFESLSEYRKSLGPVQLTRQTWIEHVQRSYEAWEKAKKARAASPAKPKEPRPRNELVDGIVRACGDDPFQATQTALKAAAVALAEIKQVYPAVTPEELERRARAYEKAQPAWVLTPSALAKHWHEFVPPPEKKVIAFPGPQGWLQWARVHLPDWRRFTDESELGRPIPPWHELDPHERHAISSQMYPHQKQA